MKRHPQQQSGFITLIVMLILILVAIIGFAYWRVSSAGKVTAHYPHAKMG